MKSNTKAKLILIFLAALISLSFVFGSNVANYPVKLSEDPVSMSTQNLSGPQASTNGAFKIYWEANGTALTDSQDVDNGFGIFFNIINDGEGGAIIAWLEKDNIFAQKINSTGHRLWGQNGTVVCNATNDQPAQQICTDKAGGAIITWEDSRGTSEDIYAQRINADGITQWGEPGKFWGGIQDRNGTVICNATNDQIAPQICTDKANGAIITWEDKRGNLAGTGPDIYAQRVGSDGTLHWGESWWSGPGDRNGTVICNATKEQWQALIVEDRAAGAIIVWGDSRNILISSEDIYAQRVSSDGTTHWGESWWSGPGDRNGTVICNETSSLYDFDICSDGANGAFIAWVDERNPSDDIYAQYVDLNGNTHCGEPGKSWGEMADLNGTVVCNAPDTQDYLYLCADGAGGAIITWEDSRGAASDDIYAQRVDPYGGTHWGDGTSWGATPDRNGTIICNSIGNQEYPSLCSDGVGGAIITWEEDVANIHDIYAQHVSSDGTTHWGDGTSWGATPDRNGTAICNKENNEILNEGHPRPPSMCSDDQYGAFIAWFNDTTGLGDYNMVAQRVRGAIPSPGGALPAGDDDDDDDEDTGAVVVVVVIIIIVSVGGVVVVIIVLIKKGIINITVLKRG